MNYKEALLQAESYFKKENGSKVTCALDTDTFWIFYGGLEGVTEIGSIGIKINKSKGTVEEFILPDDENFQLLARAKKIEIM